MRNPTTRDVHPLVATRWSPRAFADREVPRDALLRCLEAARWAPSCFNEQPWRFLVADRAEDPDGHAALAAVVNDHNRRWAPDAPVLILVGACTRFHKTGAANAHAWYDTGGAIAWFTAQATAEQLVVHQMAGFSRERARSLDLPEEVEPIAVLALGHEGDADSLPDDLAQKERAPRNRKPLEAFVYGAGWGQPLV